MLWLVFDLYTNIFNKTIQLALERSQLEIITKCKVECIYCSYLYFSETRDMSMEIFYSIASRLSNTDPVYLHGWGALPNK